MTNNSPKHRAPRPKRDAIGALNLTAAIARLVLVAHEHTGSWWPW